jgi:tetratricopeptide (TPR) repeat protein
MKRALVALVLFVLGLPVLLADIAEIAAKADQLHEQELYDQVRNFLEVSLGQAKTGQERAELDWRLARAWLNLGDQAEDQGITGSELLAFFEQGQANAQAAIDEDPSNHLGYYWLSANIGRWGQIKGILNSLFKAKPMRDLLQKAVALKPDHADSYYVLGQLYEQVPGFPLSFGDKDFAVSLGRKSVDLHSQQVQAGIEKELNYDFYTELAKHLWERNFTAAKRQQEQKRNLAKYNAATDPMEKNFYYEAVVTLQPVADRVEARQLISWVISGLEQIPNRDDGQEDDLKEAQEVQAGW